jgi:hypothetical protein
MMISRDIEIQVAANDDRRKKTKSVISTKG